MEEKIKEIQSSLREDDKVNRIERGSHDVNEM